MPLQGQVQTPSLQGLYPSRISLLPLLSNPDFFEDVQIPLLKMLRHSFTQRHLSVLWRGSGTPEHRIHCQVPGGRIPWHYCPQGIPSTEFTAPAAPARTQAAQPPPAGSSSNPPLPQEQNREWGQDTQSVLPSHPLPVQNWLLLLFTPFPFHRAAVNSIPSFGIAYPSPYDPGISVSLIPFSAGMLQEIFGKNVLTREKLNQQEFRIFFFHVAVPKSQFGSELGVCS